MKKLQEELEVSQALADEVEDKFAQAEQQADVMKEAAAKANAKATALEKALGSAVTLTGTSEQQLRALAVIVEGREPSPEETLVALAALYGDRVVILRSAHSSAKESSSFRHGTKLWGLLRRLATDYRHRMLNERGVSLPPFHGHPRSRDNARGVFDVPTET